VRRQVLRHDLLDRAVVPVAVQHGRDLDVRAVLEVLDLLVVEDLVVLVARDATDDQDVALLDDAQRAGVGLDLVLGPRGRLVLRARGGRHVGEDDRHALLAELLHRGRFGDRVRGVDDDRVDALTGHLLHRRDLALGRGLREARRDVGDQLTLDQALRLRLGELQLELLEDVVLVLVGDADRDVADLPRGLGRDLLGGPRALDDLFGIAAVDVLEPL
jgi:hypothetical protein